MRSHRWIVCLLGLALLVSACGESIVAPEGEGGYASRPFAPEPIDEPEPGETGDTRIVP